MTDRVVVPLVIAVALLGLAGYRTNDARVPYDFYSGFLVGVLGGVACAALIQIRELRPATRPFSTLLAVFVSPLVYPLLLFVSPGFAAGYNYGAASLLMLSLSLCNLVQQLSPRRM